MPRPACSRVTDANRTCRGALKMPRYRARVDRIRHAAIDAGIRPTGHAIGIASGLPAGTVNAVLAGRPPRSETIATLVRLFGVPVDELFEIIDLAD
jgi:hypothetical protein